MEASLTIDPAACADRYWCSVFLWGMRLMSFGMLAVVASGGAGVVAILLDDWGYSTRASIVSLSATTIAAIGALLGFIGALLATSPNHVDTNWPKRSRVVAYSASIAAAIAVLVARGPFGVLLSETARTESISIIAGVAVALALDVFVLSLALYASAIITRVRPRIVVNYSSFPLCVLTGGHLFVAMSLTNAALIGHGLLAWLLSTYDIDSGMAMVYTFLAALVLVLLSTLWLTANLWESYRVVRVARDVQDATSAQPATVPLE